MWRVFSPKINQTKHHKFTTFHHKFTTICTTKKI
jgi:hypothetical protein